MNLPKYFSVSRKIYSKTYKLTDIFYGLDKIACLKRLFGKNTLEILNKVKVCVKDNNHYFHINSKSGNIIASKKYLQHGAKWMIYLDIIHELAHVKQFREGKNLYDTKYTYTNRKTEVDAYKFCCKEAKRISINKKQIINYLKVPWISKKECLELARKVL